ncbi:hypothetical protein [Actinopolyspora mortivallis]|uniref:Uncharacterized protein n=1 Tax=Actinopolyspora mortivallis TaxID=33906 RepID=A0A2T0GZ15_ACTMO|nr:hypothetical protein [Actinopolyspora mortivallis]PRW64330.1 hypothetical protein CEP50_05170 [Actinopolyspora mortivallis]
MTNRILGDEGCSGETTTALLDGAEPLAPDTVEHGATPTNPELHECGSVSETVPSGEKSSAGTPTWRSWFSEIGRWRADVLK